MRLLTSAKTNTEEAWKTARSQDKSNAWGGAFAANDETLPITEYAIRKLNTYNLSRLLLMGNTTDFSGTPLEKLAEDGMFRHFRPIYKGTLIANVNMNRERGNRLIAEGFADLVAFGPPLHRKSRPRA